MDPEPTSSDSIKMFLIKVNNNTSTSMAVYCCTAAPSII